MTLSDALTTYLHLKKQTCAASTLTTYRHTIGPFLAWLSDRPLTADAIADYLIMRQEAGDAADTIKNYRRVLRTFCRWCVRRKLLPADPFLDEETLPPPRRKRARRPTWTAAQIGALLRCEPPESSSPRGYRKNATLSAPLDHRQAQIVVLALLDTGARVGEIAQLTCGQARGGELIIVGKGGDDGVLHCTRATRILLIALAGERPDAEPLWRDWFGKPASTRALRDSVRRLAERAGVTMPPRHMHAFRHYAARRWLAARLGDEIIQSLMRHRSKTTTRIYTEGGDQALLAQLHAEASDAAALAIAAGLLIPLEE